ncbi:peptidoglycan DD-metalloendopeptidase family protein [Rhodocytophaga aerolata]|uniref:Peptidoglycan DD-metalloendopeptidase family protein n=1 Tax=Rhodocytophaga aerolata TaxID=455078 RepID=A0ABT8R9E0_9BACT|nr:peptidoglycan DD-metalloendopeptidase family protein [Rhodocytophaga aerolata]MDO1448700.1 peptidoglycan DD-metalloendopeptidase family protein [Rhodocytophaga aerolata]
MQKEKKLSVLLKKYNHDFGPITSLDLKDPSLLVLDLSENNKDLQGKNLVTTESFEAYILGLMAKSGAEAAVGGYNENRIIYRRSSHFSGVENRTIHLGIDIWAQAGTEIFSPLEGKIHSFRNNIGFGDYGPTIITEHQLEDITFYILYGHLSLADVVALRKQQPIAKGELLGRIGNYPDNGDWPPHLHFQIISDMQGLEGDFPGVATPSSAKNYLDICPDPNLILNIPKLLND